MGANEMTDIPAPPPGFQVVQPAASSAPPPPAGFQIEQPVPEKWGDPGMIVPIQFSNTGGMRPAWPQILTGVKPAVESVTKAATGGYGLEIDPATGRPTAITNDMIGDAMGAASMGLTELSPAARAGAQFGKSVMSGSANRVVNRELKAAGIPFSEVGPRLSAIGPEAIVADLSPGMQARAAAIATMPGNAQKKVVDALMLRRAQANLRINQGVDAAIGPAQVPSYIKADIRASQDALGPEYQQVFAGSGVKAVDTQPIADELGSMSVTERGAAAQIAANVRKMLNVSGEKDILDPSPETLFATRKAVGLMLREAQNTGKTTEIGALKHIYGMLDQTLSEAVPGIKQIDAKYQELARQGDAVDVGQTLMESGRTAPRPAEVNDMMMGVDGQGGPQAASPLFVGPSAVPLRLSQGARAEIDRIVGTNVNDVTAMKRIVGGEGNWNRDRLVSVFGQEKADKLLGIFEREAKYAATDQLALAGSRTQVLKAAQDDIAGKGPRGNPVVSLLDFKPGTAAAQTADRGLGWIGGARRSGVNDEIANALLMRAQDFSGSASKRPPGISEKNWADLLTALGASTYGNSAAGGATVLPGPRR